MCECIDRGGGLGRYGKLSCVESRFGNSGSREDGYNRESCESTVRGGRVLLTGYDEVVNTVKHKSQLAG